MLSWQPLISLFLFPTIKIFVMKKFIAVFDGLNFNASSLRYSLFLSQHAKVHLVGIFLEDYTRHSYGVAEITGYEGSDFDKHMHDLNEKEKEDRDSSVEQFELACQDAGINYSVHRDRNVALQEVLHESIYADLVIIGSEETLTRYQEPLPSRFIRELLNDVQCPVLIVPAKYKPVDKVVMLYDGEPSSVFAVRSFSYLFESLKHLETEIVTVKPAEESLHLPDNRLIKEFIRRHYPKAEYVILKGLPEDVIIKYLNREKKNPLVVLGAYRRNKFSRLFRPSMADYLLQHLDMPLFIAHNKS
jgi:nucleotide-binding universal stress UspA family protein